MGSSSSLVNLILRYTAVCRGIISDCGSRYQADGIKACSLLGAEVGVNSSEVNITDIDGSCVTTCADERSSAGAGTLTSKLCLECLLSGTLLECLLEGCSLTCSLCFAGLFLSLELSCSGEFSLSSLLKDLLLRVPDGLTCALLGLKSLLSLSQALKHVLVVDVLLLDLQLALEDGLLSLELLPGGVDQLLFLLVETCEVV